MQQIIAGCIEKAPVYWKIKHTKKCSEHKMLIDTNNHTCEMTEMEIRMEPRYNKNKSRKFTILISKHKIMAPHLNQHNHSEQKYSNAGRG